MASEKVPQATAILRNYRVSPYKARLVAAQIRGKRAAEATRILQFNSRKSALVINKLLHSAMANAENTLSIDTDVGEMIISELYVDEGRTLKRIRPRAKGRADRILKRSCHITLKISEVPNNQDDDSF